MNLFERKRRERLRQHPEIWRSLFSNPGQDTLSTVREYLVEQPVVNLAPWLFPVLPLWEQEACEGNELIAQIIQHLETSRLSPLPTENELLRPALQRIRILATTPGLFPFSVEHIQKDLVKFLESAELLADLPELEVVAFGREELFPLRRDLVNFHLAPLSRRYVLQLFHPERKEAILSLLAHVAKNYPVLGTCRQAYAVMLSLEKKEVWSQNPFCLRLLANRFWEFYAADTAYAEEV
ncbi:hypothetical protein CEB3_c34710 [Peptococcaceae bacterium CEB3]|nr:hypothetical protein CEB3_c34710 [Peptococcaceae bacterium CEB3]